MIQLGLNLTFNGQCEEAFHFYERCFGGKIDFMMRWGESSMADFVDSDWADKVTHASMTIGEQQLCGSDSPALDGERPRRFTLILNLSDPAKTERIFANLADEGLVRLDLQETQWSAKFGMVTDKFGIPWMLNCERERAILNLKDKSRELSTPFR